MEKDIGRQLVYEACSCDIILMLNMFARIEIKPKKRHRHSTKIIVEFHESYFF